MIGGIGMALMEHSVVDTRNGRVTNANLAEYAVPVHADAPPVMDVIFVDEHDPHVNPLGVKGLGEILLSASQRRSPTPSSMRPASASANCRSRRTSCSERAVLRRCAILAARNAPMDMPTSDFVRAGSLAELEAKGRLVVHGRHSPILVIYDGGHVFALDNRCPHMGFPLDRGSVEDGILTCHWHHARFDLASGCTFDLWADDVPTCPVEVRDGEVWIRPSFGHADPSRHWRQSARRRPRP